MGTVGHCNVLNLPPIKQKRYSGTFRTVSSPKNFSNKGGGSSRAKISLKVGWAIGARCWGKTRRSHVPPPLTNFFFHLSHTHKRLSLALQQFAPIASSFSFSTLGCRSLKPRRTCQTQLYLLHPSFFIINNKSKGRIRVCSLPYFSHFLSKSYLPLRSFIFSKSFPDIFWMHSLSFLLL